MTRAVPWLLLSGLLLSLGCFCGGPATPEQGGGAGPGGDPGTAGAPGPGADPGGGTCLVERSQCNPAAVECCMDAPVCCQGTSPPTCTRIMDCH